MEIGWSETLEIGLDQIFGGINVAKNARYQ